MARISGRLINTDTKTPVPFVLVQADGLSGSSDAGGRFYIDVQAGRIYMLMVRSPLYGPVTTSVNVSEDREYNLGDIQLKLAIFSYRNI